MFILIFIYPLKLILNILSTNKNEDNLINQSKLGLNRIEFGILFLDINLWITYSTPLGSFVINNKTYNSNFDEFYHYPTL